MAEVSLSAKTCRKCGSSFVGMACGACSRIRAAAYYFKNSKKVNARNAAYTKAHPEIKRARTAKWAKANPDKVAASRERNKDKHSVSVAAWQARNPERVASNGAAYRTANKEKCLVATTGWKKAHPEAIRIHRENRRAREMGGKLSTGLPAKLFSLQRGKCAYCSSDFRKTSYHLDHIMPLSKGGANDNLNMQLLCPTCNLQKHAKHPIDFMQEKGRLL